jgi:ABC-type iron transport system FetAB ATPase subunit
MLRIDHLRVRNLPPLSFAIHAGECLAIEGPSGCGKTRLLRAIADLDAADGSVFFEGAERNEMSASSWRKQVRFVASEPVWWADTPRAHMINASHAEDLLAALGLDEALLDRRLDTLSTGERQRLALVRALGDAPKVLLLDEPTATLDTTSSALVDRMLSGLLDAGRTILLVSHDPVQIERLAHMRLQLSDPARQSSHAVGIEIPAITV